MKQQSLPTYSELEKVLDKTVRHLSPSQVQGIVCGILCANPKDPSSVDWKTFLLGEAPSKGARTLLQTLYDVSAKQLQDFLFDFQLILPDDEEPLSLRAEALTLWCQGVLTGLKLIGVPLEGRAPSEMTETIDDLIEIAKMNYEDVISSEEDEEAYTELVEYVRMAMILIYQDLCALETTRRGYDA